MEKNGKIEQDLSEEQLQEITGGCAQCTADTTQANNHLGYYSSYQGLYDKAVANGKGETEAAKSFLTMANGHLTAYANLVKGIENRGEH